MKIENWTIAGQLWSAMTDVLNFCREACRLMNVGPQILVWLNTIRGREVLMTAVQMVVAKWKVEYESKIRVNRITIDSDDFEKLCRDCWFEGRIQNASEDTFPSTPSSVGQTLEFQEVAWDAPLPQGCVIEFIKSRNLRPAQPLEFLAWLRKNQIAGIATSIHCAIPGVNQEAGNYLYCCICGGGGRGLHLDRPSPDNKWQAATVFLGVKI